MPIIHSKAVLEKIKEMQLKHKSVAKIKLEALKAKRHTDCSFLVGLEGGELEEFHGIKSDLMIVSGFMEGMFNSELCPEFPVRINNMKPKTFEMIMEHAHVGQVVSECNCIEATELAIAADHLLIDSLKPECFELISLQVTRNTVWTVLDTFFKFGLTDMASSCHELLSTDTNMCLQEKTFLTASMESVNELLKLDQLFIPSEKPLIDYCYKWAQNTSDAREAMRSLLPNFRLLTLRPSEAIKLSYFLTSKEQVNLLTYFITDKTDSMQPTLSTRVENRQSAGIKKQLILDHVFKNASLEPNWQYCNKTELNITTNFNILLTKVTGVYGKKRLPCYLKFIKNGVNCLEHITTAELLSTVDHYNPLYELKFKKPISISKNAPLILTFCVHPNDISDSYPAVPSSVFDLESSGATTKSHFKQLHFDKNTNNPVFIHSFTYQIDS